LLALTLTLTLTLSAWADSPQVGDNAPDFTLQDQNGEWHQLSDYEGKYLAIDFYPKNDTPGCTTEACNFRDNFYQFKRVRAEVVGVSIDDVDSHKAFASKYKLPFTLLADKNGDLASAYGRGPCGWQRRAGVFHAQDSQSRLVQRLPGRIN